ncbi:MAG: Gfo/Idh/MocA family oxidoreductase [Verrucomicrobiota bacterium]|nr:Gfo/Idh/MocA family oxidoreductase [Verrucomicrobiota bacterium]MEC8905765.1 Gfo/Idh/MocA family oxidoreductase [Verrucomicrobiota bacterium]
MSNTIKAGVIGTGAIGKNHARIYSEIDSADLVAVFDTDTDAAEEIVNLYGGVLAGSIEEFSGLVDVVSVATPTNTHRSIGESLLERGKHLLIEKPIADSATDAQALVNLAAEMNCVLQVGHIERFNPVLGEIEERLKDPRFIEVHRLSPFPNRSMDIGVVLDLMIHDLEIVLHLVKSKIQSIDAVGVPVLTEREDIANARIRFDSGCVANITASRISPEKMRKLRVFEGDSYLSLDYQAQEGQFYWKDGMEIKMEPVEVEKDEPLKRELEAFVECASMGRQPAVSGHEATAALELAIEITNLIDSGNKG